jgi:hypothetical protein
MNIEQSLRQYEGSDFPSDPKPDHSSAILWTIGAAFLVAMGCVAAWVLFG